MVPGIAPKEASERLVISQGRFDELWRKYITYSGKQETLYILMEHTMLYNVTMYTHDTMLYCLKGRPFNFI